MTEPRSQSLKIAMSAKKARIEACLSIYFKSLSVSASPKAVKTGLLSYVDIPL